MKDEEIKELLENMAIALQRNTTFSWKSKAQITPKQRRRLLWWRYSIYIALTILLMVITIFLIRAEVFFNPRVTAIISAIIMLVGTLFFFIKIFLPLAKGADYQITTYQIDFEKRSLKISHSASYFTWHHFYSKHAPLPALPLPEDNKAYYEGLRVYIYQLMKLQTGFTFASS